jgi:cell division protein FtsQ
MKEKNKKKKRRRKKYYLLKFILFIGFCTGLYYFISSPFFDIQNLTVKDNSYYTPQQIIAIAKADKGGNLFNAPVKEMKDRLLKDPYIRNARISKKLPNELIFIVEERQDAAAITYGDNFLIIDREGMVLRQAEAEPLLTIISGMTLTNIQIGTALEAEENSMLTGTLKLLDAMEEHDIFFKKINFSGVLIKAYVYDNLFCQGSPENILKSMDDLEDVLYDLYMQGIERGVIKVGGNGYYSFSALVE